MTGDSSYIPSYAENDLLADVGLCVTAQAKAHARDETQQHGPLALTLSSGENQSQAAKAA